MKRKDGKMSENMTMTGGDIAATEGVEEELEDMTMDEVVTKLDEVFELPDIEDKKFWATEIKFQTEEYAIHCHKLDRLVGYNQSTLWAKGPLCGTALMHAGYRVLNTGGGNGIIEVKQWVELFRNSMKTGTYNERDETDLITFALKMALTDPRKAFEFNKGVLLKVNQYLAWAAAYAIFGAPWKNRVKWNDKNGRRMKRQAEEKEETTPKTSFDVNIHVGFMNAVL